MLRDMKLDLSEFDSTNMVKTNKEHMICSHTLFPLFYVIRIVTFIFQSNILSVAPHSPSLYSILFDGTVPNTFPS